jgi:nucleoside-diphosphate-sugar epimerase
VARVLVVGAGYVGIRLGLRLAARGDEVFALRRQTAEVPASLRGLAADVTEPESLAVIPGDLAAVVITVAPDATTDEDYARTYVEGTRNVLAALERRSCRPSRLLFTSSTAVYAQRDGEWVDERSPAEPTTFPGRRLLEAERAVAAYGPGATVLRLGAIYGPGRGGLVERVREGRATYPIGAPSYGNRNHVDDCAGALAHLLELRSPEPMYLGVDHEPADLRVVLEWLAARIAAPPPQATAGAATPRGATSKRASNHRLLASGYRFAFPTFREGYASFVPAAPRAE